ncbi:hypothetical protein HW555_005571 [Spodoptera exigua]|uniref:Uncharacterized protein n=1 Tax=Spodoptera exigua TaxID=7107 RepID=A0A835GGQ0_SPOEX|nr:hypothetical protein HW555_005571 [Spodoptera exigua]
MKYKMFINSIVTESNVRLQARRKENQLTEGLQMKSPSEIQDDYTKGPKGPKVNTLPPEPSVQKDGLPKDSELANSAPSEQSPVQTKSPSPIELSKWKSTTDEVTTTETIKNVIVLIGAVNTQFYLPPPYFVQTFPSSSAEDLVAAVPVDPQPLPEQPSPEQPMNPNLYLPPPQGTISNATKYGAPLLPPSEVILLYNKKFDE